MPKENLHAKLPTQWRSSRRVGAGYFIGVEGIDPEPIQYDRNVDFRLCADGVLDWPEVHGTPMVGNNMGTCILPPTATLTAFGVPSGAKLYRSLAANRVEEPNTIFVLLTVSGQLTNEFSRNMRSAAREASVSLPVTARVLPAARVATSVEICNSSAQVPCKQR